MNAVQVRKNSPKIFRFILKTTVEPPLFSVFKFENLVKIQVGRYSDRDLHKINHYKTVGLVMFSKYLIYAFIDKLYHTLHLMVLSKIATNEQLFH